MGYMMNRETRRSLLQVQILSELQRGFAPSITALAEGIGAERSSVSRSLHALAEQGLVWREGRRWNATELGTAEATLSLTKLQDSMVDVINATDRRYEAINRAMADATVIPSVEFIQGTQRLWESADTAVGLWGSSMDAIDALSSIGSLPSAMEAMIGIGSAESLANPMEQAIGVGSLSTPGTMDQIVGFGSSIQDFDLSTMVARYMDSATQDAIDVAFAPPTAFEMPMINLLDAPLAHHLSTDFVSQLVGSADMTNIALGGDALALAKSVETFITDRMFMSSAIGVATSNLIEWSRAYEGFSSPLWDLDNDTAKHRLQAFAQMDTPEPLFSDVLRVSGLNSQLIHTPNFPIPAVVPMRSEEDVWQRQEAAARGKINAASDARTQLERGLRRLIHILLAKLHGPNWWSRKCIPEAIRADAEHRKFDAEAKGALPDHPLQYTYTMELRDIIVSQHNWGGVFAPVFGNKIVVVDAFSWIEPVRNACSHSRASSDEQIVMFNTGVTWLLWKAAPVLRSSYGDVSYDA